MKMRLRCFPLLQNKGIENVLYANLFGSASDLGMYRFFQFRPLNLKISVSLEPLMGTHYAAVHNILRLLISENGNPLSSEHICVREGKSTTERLYVKSESKKSN